MKTKIFLLALVSLALFSCYEDKDGTITASPEYVTSVEGINSTDSYLLYLGSTFQINTTVKLTDGAKASDYEYRWLVGKSEEISTEQDLNWEIYLPEGYSLNSDIPGVYVVRNKVNGLEYRQTFKFKVQTGYAPTYIAIYETSKGTVEWMSLQGTPQDFTRTFPNMIEKVNRESKQIDGKYIGSLNSTDELAIFTDHAPDHGQTISMVDTEPGENEFDATLGKIIAPISGRVYVGATQTLNFSNIFYGVGSVKYITLNGRVHFFDGTSKKLPVFDDNTFVMTSDVQKIMSSKQFMRYKRANFAHHTDKTVSCFHIYSDVAYKLTETDGSTPFTVDEMCGMFSEATGLGSNKPYIMHLIAKKNNAYNLYVFSVPFVGTKVQPLKLTKVVPIPTAIAESAITWFGAFSTRYGFYATKNTIVKFDYLNITEFSPETTPFRSYDSKYEILDVFVMISGSGLKDADDCTVVFLYDKVKGTTTIDVYNTLTGATINTYADVIPGRGVEFIKR